MAYHKKIVNQRNPRRNAGLPQKTRSKITALYNTNPRSVQLVARNRELRTEVEFPRSVQLVARKTYPKTTALYSAPHRGEIFRESRCTLHGITHAKSFVHQNSRYGLKVKMRVGDKAGGYELPF